MKLKGLINVVWRRNRYMCGYFIFNSLSLSSFYLELPRINTQSMVRGGARKEYVGKKIRFMKDIYP